MDVLDFKRVLDELQSKTADLVEKVEGLKNEVKNVNNQLRSIYSKTNSVIELFGNPGFAERVVCNDEDKESLKATIDILMDMVESFRKLGYFSISKFSDKLNMPVFKHIEKMVINRSLSTIDALADIFLPYFVACNLRGKELVENILVYECIYNVINGMRPIALKYRLYAFIGLLPD